MSTLPNCPRDQYTRRGCQFAYMSIISINVFVQLAICKMRRFILKIQDSTHTLKSASLHDSYLAHGHFIDRAQ